MRIMTILGTRPEIIRLSRIIPLLDSQSDHILVHTGQNAGHLLSGQFFDELGIRPPNHMLGIQAPTPASQIGQILTETEALMLSYKPDRLFILGDTNSGLSAIIARRLGIPVYHAEAGNRCFDKRVPEETNRRIIDHCSDVLMPYTQHSRQYLIDEGFEPSRIHVTGNPIGEVLGHYMPYIRKSRILDTLGLEKHAYALVTLHRAENVDDPETLGMYLSALETIARTRGVEIIISTHPRLKQKLGGTLQRHSHMRFLDAFGFFDFIQLQRQALCVLTDSGTVQEECCILGVRCITLRQSTERPETLEAGANLLGGNDVASILASFDYSCRRNLPAARVPDDYRIPDVSSRIGKLLLT